MKMHDIGNLAKTIFLIFPEKFLKTFASTRFLGAGGGGGRSDRAMAPLDTHFLSTF